MADSTAEIGANQDTVPDKNINYMLRTQMHCTCYSREKGWQPIEVDAVGGINASKRYKHRTLLGS